MDYFKILNLNKEPFSNSPDPDFFFQSQSHLRCLQKLELSIRLRRGLNVIIGDVGSGKTTLCRQMIRRFAADGEIETHLILNPVFDSPEEFLTAIVQMFEGTGPDGSFNEWRLKEGIKQYLFHRGVDEKKTVVLIIDEGQKIPAFCLEILRELLNYETNEYKLLQIIIFAQNEFNQTLDEYRNFTDRINLRHVLEPLSFRDTRLMIQYRLNQASETGKAKNPFTYPALRAIHRATQGYPRKIINLCHQSILAMIIQNRSRAGWFTVQSSIKRTLPWAGRRRSWLKWGAAVAALLLLVLLFDLSPDRWKSMAGLEAERPQDAYSLPQASPSIEVKSDLARAADQEVIRSNDAPNLTASKTNPSKPEEAAISGQETKEVKPEIAPAILTRTGTYPKKLGRLVVRKNETLGEMIHNIYGTFNPTNLNLVIRVNPDLKNPDRIPVGYVIDFPTITADVELDAQKAWWVKLGEPNGLEEAYEIIRDHGLAEQPVRLIPYWNPREGLRFAVICGGAFLSEHSAHLFMNMLPAEMTREVTIISSWDRENVFYSDPFMWKGPFRISYQERISIED